MAGQSLTPPSWSEIGESGPCPALERQREAGIHKAEPALQLTEATEQNKTTVAHCSSGLWNLSPYT